MLATIFVASLASAQAAHWFVIMAGSNTYMNYRHQADTCHAYQIALKHGIPKSNIIHLAFDDIANNEQNPFKGKIFNKPAAGEGVDVYEGCNIDYKGRKVSGKNFLKVLTGDTSAGGPVLKSTSKDQVFIYFADHGGPGLLGTPTGNPIHAKDVNKALVTMHQKDMYKELLFYVEACESGSIFANLLKAPNVKAVTAANPNQPSWGWYCAPQDKVNGKHLHACLADQFSAKWMEDADVADFSKETILEQVTRVTKETNKSKVSQYGVHTFDSEILRQFEGEGKSAGSPGQSATTDGDDIGVLSRDVEVHIAEYNVQAAETDKEKEEAETALKDILAKRKVADERFFKIAMSVTADDELRARMMLDNPITSITKIDCHYDAVAAYIEHCGVFTDYSMRYSRLFVNLCETGWPTDQVIAGITDVCGKDSLSSRLSEGDLVV